MKKRNNVTRNITYGFELADYLIAHPEITEKHNSQNFIIFTEAPHDLNRKNADLLEQMKEEGKGAIKATRRRGTRNSWKFETVSP